jgi:hypothetical protein
MPVLRTRAEMISAYLCRTRAPHSRRARSRVISPQACAVLSAALAPRAQAWHAAGRSHVVFFQGAAPVAAVSLQGAHGECSRGAS